MQISLRYGFGLLHAEVADQRVIVQVRITSGQVIEDIPKALEAALANPTGPALHEVIRSNERVLVMTVDHTRPNPSPILWPLIERIEALGAKPEIMIGLGNHKAMTADELEKFLGIREAHQNECRHSEPWDLGKTRFGHPIEVSPILREFDRRIVVGFIEPHYIAGFSGGRKMVLPGCASHRTTTFNHFLTLPHGPQLGRLEGNPVHADMEDAACAVGVDFICDVLLTADDDFASIHCGGLIEAHHKGVEEARKLYQATIPRRADIVICSPGGAPYDVDMVQAKKALAPALDCVKPGGAVILVGQCPRGWGATPADRDLLEPGKALEVRNAIEADIRKGIVERSWPACSPGALFTRVVHDAQARLIIVSELDAELEGTYVETAPDLQTAIALAEETVGENSEIIILHDGRRCLIN